MIYLYPYKSGSRSARALAQALDGRVLRRQGSTFRPGPGRHVVNWGACNCPSAYNALNPSSLTRIARDKLQTFRRLSTATGALTLPRVPRWATDRQEASEWLSGGRTIVCRETLTGQSGDGIIIVERGQSLPQVPLYVEYVPKDHEYRVHVFKQRNGTVEVIDVQRKVRDPEREPSTWKVRSHRNGFIFTRHDTSGRSYKDHCTPDVRQQAIRALVVSGLDFGAVDVVMDKTGRAYVLEINTAPGLEGTTIQVYRDAFRRYFAS